MFSGIVETTAQISEVRPGDETTRIFIDKPSKFNDLSVGDSIAVDGVCLTVESFSTQTMGFAVGPETLRVTGWTESNVLGRVVNLERSLLLNSRVHGHLVTGHVDAVGKVSGCFPEGETMRLKILFPKSLAPYIWSKGSIAINGVSLTVNEVQGHEFQVGLIPETLSRTNLMHVKPGSLVNLEVDNFARGMVRLAELKRELQNEP